MRLAGQLAQLARQFGRRGQDQAGQSTQILDGGYLSEQEPPLILGPTQHDHEHVRPGHALGQGQRFGGVGRALRAHRLPFQPIAQGISASAVAIEQ
jgi:hypothetical protein